MSIDRSIVVPQEPGLVKRLSITRADRRAKLHQGRRRSFSFSLLPSPHAKLPFKTSLGATSVSPKSVLVVVCVCAVQCVCVRVCDLV